MVTIETLNVGQGDKPLYLEDAKPEERAALAAEILGMMKKGFTLFLIQGEECRQITGYDEASNQWTVLSDAKPAPNTKKEKVDAKNSKVKAIGQTAGG